MDNTVWGVRLSADEHEYLEGLASQTDGILTKAGVVRVLIRQAQASAWNPLDSSGTLGLAKRSEEASPSSSSYTLTSSSSSSSSIEDKTKEKKQSKKESAEPSAGSSRYPERERRAAVVRRTKGSPEFESFWGIYQSCTKKVNNQSKAKAWECWEQLVPEMDPADLIKAITISVEQIRMLESAGEFAAPLPDAFRWLRDERYAVALENHSPTESNKPSWML